MKTFFPRWRVELNGDIFCWWLLILSGDFFVVGDLSHFLLMEICTKWILFFLAETHIKWKFFFCWWVLFCECNPKQKETAVKAITWIHFTWFFFFFFFFFKSISAKMTEGKFNSSLSSTVLHLDHQWASEWRKLSLSCDMTHIFVFLFDPIEGQPV